MNRIKPTYGFCGPIGAGLPSEGEGIGIFVDDRGVVVSVRQPIHLPAREDVT